MVRSSIVPPSYVPDRFAWRRRASAPVTVGDLVIGGDAPVVIQSMCTTPTQDVEATIGQCISLAEAGCQLIRITAPGVKDAKALGPIRAGFSAAGFASVPLVADIHFMPAAAMEAIEHVEKVRINPGNFADKKRFEVRDYTDAEYQAELERVRDRFLPLVKRAKELGRAMRIGVNHGSLSDRIMNRFGDTPAGMVEAAMEFLQFAEGEQFHNSIISMKSSNPKVMVQAYRLLCTRLEEHGYNYPLHVGVTEAGDGDDGRVKGAAGIGALLEDGIGDTIRVSLTEPPEAEVPVASALANRYDPPPFASAPLAGACPPKESVDPYSYRRRTAEIVRFGSQDDAASITLGGGQLPRVLVPRQLPSSDLDGPAADAMVDADLPGEAPGQRATPTWPEAVPVHDLAAGATECPSPLPGLVLFDLRELGDPDALQRSLAALPAEAVVGIGHPGRFGATRAYRLLAAADEAAFGAAELTAAGSGIRHAIVLALLDTSDLLTAASVCGGLLIDGIGDALYLPRLERPRDLAFTILQAVKARTTRADYVACPSCGRTLFDLIEVTDHVRQATAHLQGVTIAIMGCIVNGPGEMADADFGFVGSGPGKVTLYRSKEAVRRNIPFDGARDELIELIKADGKWSDPA